MKDRASYLTVAYLARRDFPGGKVPDPVHSVTLSLYRKRGGSWRGYFCGDPDAVILLKKCVSDVSKAWKARREQDGREAEEAQEGG